jgi:hypothetical protein
MYLISPFCTILAVLPVSHVHIFKFNHLLLLMQSVYHSSWFHCYPHLQRFTLSILFLAARKFIRRMCLYSGSYFPCVHVIFSTF